LKFGILGPLVVVGGNESVLVRGTKRRGLLAYLLVHAGDAVALDRLVEDLWDEQAASGARGTVQTYLSQLRKLLAGSDEVTLETRPGGYVLDVPTDCLDARRFEDLCAQAAQETDTRKRVALLDEALGLWRGVPLGEFAGSEWADVECTRLQTLRVRALQARTDARLNLGQHAEAIPELERLVREHSLDEQFWAQLMVAYYRSGRQAHALRAYQRARALLADELGVEPGTQLQELERQILDHAPELMLAAPAPPIASTEPPLPEGVVTFLLTDIEGSTSMWDKDPNAMSRAIARYEELVGQTVEEQHGFIVKSRGEGDSTLSVFPRAGDAATAAVALQGRLLDEEWPAGLVLATRMALHTGEAHLRDGDYYGGSLNRAARIRGLGHGGQTLCSRSTRDLIADTLPEEMQLIELGTHALRGLQRPEQVYELGMAGLPSQFPPLVSLDAFPTTIDLPDPSFARADEELAGRGVELQYLESAWRKAATGARQVALISGEPGMGKSRLAYEFAQRVRAQDVVVLYGRCDEDTIVPYQPFVEALRPCVAAYSPATLHQRLRGLEQDLARVFPELMRRMPDQPQATPDDPEAERYRLFEAMTGVMTGVTATQSVVLVLDDLHWAEKPTLLLLRHIMRSVQDAPLFIIGCYREMELARDHPLTDLVADLRRERFVTWIALDGLGEPESRALLEGLARDDINTSLSAALHRETGGNPLFLAELLRHLMETDRVSLGESESAQPIDLGALDMPDGVRDVVARRLRRLPSPINEVLGTAAVVGLEFDPALVGRAVQRPTEEILDALDQAIEARLIREDPGCRGGYAFSHALIRQTVYQALGRAGRTQMHARVGAAMEEESDGLRSAAALAQHFTQAVPLVGASKAIEYSARAGHDALEDLAFEDSVTHFERALQVLDEYAPTDQTRRVDLLTDLASAMVYVDERDGVETARLAVEAARADGSPAQLGRSVAVLVEPTYSAAAFPAEVTSLFDQARSVLGDSEPALRARLLAYEAFKYAAYQLQVRDGRALAEEAVTLARSAGDPLTLADGLYALAFNLEGGPDVADRLALGEELVRLGKEVGPQARAYGLHVLARAHLERAEPEALTTATTELGHIGGELRWLPARVYAARWQATQALLEGRFDDVRAWGDELRRNARAYHGAAGMQTHQAFYLAREEGVLAQASAVGHVTAEQIGNVYMTACVALAQLEAGDAQAALDSLDLLASRDFHRGEWESARGGALGMLAEVAATVGNAAHASALYDLLAPFEGRLLAAVYGIACLGAADRYLGMLSAALERWEDAEVHFERALALEEQIGGTALLPRTRYWQARCLRGRGHPGDDGAAHALLARVVEDTARLGMQHLQEQAEELLPA
jgi:DNA-binding SARP family transcriptional activator